jgi:hypothetical protein
LKYKVLLNKRINILYHKKITMTQSNELQKQPLHTATLTKRMLQGAAIGLVLISMFLLAAGEGDPSWHRLWMIRPLIMVPVAGAMGGVFYYFMDHLRYGGDWKRKAAANLISLVGYIIALWLGTVLGLDGTMWN